MISLQLPSFVALRSFSVTTLLVAQKSPQGFYVHKVARPTLYFQDFHFHSFEFIDLNKQLINLHQYNKLEVLYGIFCCCWLVVFKIFIFFKYSNKLLIKHPDLTGNYPSIRTDMQFLRLSIQIIFSYLCGVSSLISDGIYGNSEYLRHSSQSYVPQTILCLPFKLYEHLFHLHVFICYF